MRKALLVIACVTFVVLVLIVGGPDAADRLGDATVRGLQKGIAFFVVGGVVVTISIGAMRLVRKFRAGWRPRLSMMARAAVSLGVLWAAGAWAWDVVHNWSAFMSAGKILTVYLAPPILAAVAALLARWVYAARQTA